MKEVALLVLATLPVWAQTPIESLIDTARRGPTAAGLKDQITKTLGGGMKFTWNSVVGKIYRVASKANMTSPWTDLSSNITATGTTTSWTDTVKSHTNQQFYTVYSTN